MRRSSLLSTPQVHRATSYIQTRLLIPYDLFAFGKSREKNYYHLFNILSCWIVGSEHVWSWFVMYGWNKRDLRQLLRSPGKLSKVLRNLLSKVWRRSPLRSPGKLSKVLRNLLSKVWRRSKVLRNLLSKVWRRSPLTRGKLSKVLRNLLSKVWRRSPLTRGKLSKVLRNLLSKVWAKFYETY